jgi:hypothetical protein
VDSTSHAGNPVQEPDSVTPFEGELGAAFDPLVTPLSSPFELDGTPLSNVSLNLAQGNNSRLVGRRTRVSPLPTDTLGAAPERLFSSHAVPTPSLSQVATASPLLGKSSLISMAKWQAESSLQASQRPYNPSASATSNCSINSRHLPAMAQDAESSLSSASDSAHHVLDGDALELCFVEALAGTVPGTSLGLVASPSAYEGANAESSSIGVAARATRVPTFTPQQMEAVADARRGAGALAVYAGPQRGGVRSFVMAKVSWDGSDTPTKIWHGLCVLPCTPRPHACFPFASLIALCSHIIGPSAGL